MEEGSLKRKLPSSPGTSKRLRDSEPDSCSQESSSVSEHAGTIKKITLINFMCHTALDIDLGRGVTFVTGRNGTGKSAILTAIVIGLGGKASDTNRGFSLKEFIKTNETSASIKIVINNCGYNAFQPEKYGDEIIVQRTINTYSSNQYKIMSSSGCVISTKHDDLQHILLALNLQVDNPVALLTQDTARNFLHNTRPTDKYQFFLKATRLEHIESIYRRVQQSLIASRDTQTFRSKALQDITSRKNELEKRLKNLHSMEQTRDRLEAVQNELCWAHVCQQECVLEEKELAVSEQEKLCEGIKADVSKLEDKSRLIAENKKQLEIKSQELLAESNKFNAKCLELKKAAEAMNNKCKDKLEEIDSKKEDIEKLKANIATLDSKIVKMQDMLNKEKPRNKEDMEISIANLIKEGEEVDAQIKTHQYHLNQLQFALSKDCDNARCSEDELRQLQTKIAKTKAKLMSIGGQDEILLGLFGDYVIALNKSIKKAYDNGLFSEMPRGPIGSYIKVKDESWAPAVESIIGSEILRSYYVNSHEDRKLLYKLLHQVMGTRGPLPSITATKFVKKVYDYRRNAVQCPGYSSVIDMLEVSDPVVTNCLIDLIGIEGILLVESPRDAREMMKCERNVPLNCKRTVTKSGDTIYPDPNYRYYSGDDRNMAKFLQVSVEEVKRGLNKEITDCGNWASRAASQKAEIVKRIESHKIEIKKAKELVVKLSSKKTGIAKQLREMQQLEVNEVDNIDFWIGERDSMYPLLEKAEQQLKEAKAQHDNLRRAYKALLEEYGKHKEVAKEKTREIDSVVSKSNHFDNKLMQIHSSLKIAVKKKVEYERMLEKLILEVSKQKEVVGKRIADALTLTSERIDTERSASEINEEIRELKNKIERVERCEGNPKEIGEQYNAAKKKFEELSIIIKALDDCITKLKRMLKHRKEIYSKCLLLLVTRVKMVFQSLIDRRRFQGGIVVDHKEHTLDIKVTLRNTSPDKQLKAGAKRGDPGAGADPKSLSGGERSFCTVAFILALWDAVELPFYALDEFDVFMDNMNREWALDLLIKHSKEKKDFQFVFLTPQPLNSLLEKDGVSVICMQSHAAQRKAVS